MGGRDEAVKPRQKGESDSPTASRDVSRDLSPAINSTATLDAVARNWIIVQERGRGGIRGIVSKQDRRDVVENREILEQLCLGMEMTEVRRIPCAECGTTWCEESICEEINGD